MWLWDGGWLLADGGQELGSAAHSPGAGHDVPLWPLFAAVLP